jgi:chromate reductase, NAD(P)H dehydrogenase (quinone)
MTAVRGEFMSDVTNAIRIVGISGSLRGASFNTALLKLLKEKAAPEISIDVVTLEHIPFYNEDFDKAPQLPTVAEFRNRIEISDGVLIATPEYNHGIPGVLKNALDWASRPHSNSCFKGKPVSIISSSPAFTGGVRAQYQLREALIAMYAHLVMGPEVVIGGVNTKFVGDSYSDDSGLEFVLCSLHMLREEIRLRRSTMAKRTSDK